VFSNAKSESIFGPLDDACVVKHHTGEYNPLPQHHRLICWLLREAWPSQY
ncbi:uncharacterized, partial [Tachysurus ichikawai]